METFPRSRIRGASAAKVGISLVLVVVVLGGAGWWFGLRGVMERRAEAAARVEEALAQQRERRLALYGERALAQGVEFRTSGLGYRILTPGEGKMPALSDTIRIIYTGSLKDGHIFDQAKEPAEFTLGRLVPGMATGIQLLRPGGSMELFIPPSLGYGNRMIAGIPAGSGLIFDVTLVEIK
jgi:FKBP-type peptidyl-prolyl cis-trans isomerase